jgi:hypothetical protein
MLTEIIKIIFEIIKRRKEDISIFILTEEEVDLVDFSKLKEAKKEEAKKKEFPIYMGDEKIN